MSATLNKKLVWFLHIIGWFIFFISIFIDFPFHLNIEEDRLYMHLVFTSLMAGFFYFIYFYLFPKFFNRKKIIYFITICLTIIIGLSILLDYAFSVFIGEKKFNHEPPPNERMMPPPQNNLNNQEMGPPPPPHKGPKRNPTQGILFFGLVAALSISIRATSEWFNSERIKKELENEKLKAELTALKAQINPHFFFNVMNNLCSLARKKSDKTEEYIIRLSQIMRYSINSVNDEFTSLEKEVDFIRNYLEVLKLSFPQESNIKFDVEGNVSTYKIAPMILFEFIDNAFKHGHISGPDTFINILLKVENGQILFEVFNSISSQSNKFLISESGTGLDNLKRRLKLLYPENHQLFIKKESKTFYVKLIINLIS